MVWSRSRPLCDKRVNNDTSARSVPRRYVQEFGHNCGTRNLDEHYVIQADAVERVQESKLSLDLVCLDHTLKNIADGKRLSLACEMICNGKDSA